MLQDFYALFANMPGGDIAWKVMMFVVVLSVLVFVHEWGHYIAARMVRIGVQTFSIGFGTELWGFNDKNGTRWKLCLVPLGGYVRLLGDTPEAEAALTREQRKYSFFSKNVYARMWVVFAGPLVNFLFAIIVLAGLMMAGEQKIAPVVGKVQENSAAAEAGLQSGDRIVMLNSQEVQDWDTMAATIAQNGGVAIPAVLLRGSERVFVTITPRLLETKDVFGDTQKIGILGITASGQADRVTIKHSFGEAVVLGVTKTYDYTAMTLKAIGRMITGAMPAEIGGPISIGDMAGESAKHGFYSLLMFAAIISINLGLINLFPIPVLDGGHLVFFAVEAVIGKPVGDKVQDIGFRNGLSLVVLLMVFATYKDIMRHVLPYFAPLVGDK